MLEPPTCTEEKTNDDELVEEQPEKHKHLKRRRPRRRPFDRCPNCQTFKNQVAVNEREIKRLRELLWSQEILASGGDPGEFLIGQDFMQAAETPLGL